MNSRSTYTPSLMASYTRSTNTGRRDADGGRKIDLVVLGDGELRADKNRVFRDKAIVRALIEVKYCCNLRQLGFGSACDEIHQTMQSLGSQLSLQFDENAPEFAGFRLKLRGELYGLVFGSYAKTTGIDDAAIGGQPRT